MPARRACRRRCWRGGAVVDARAIDGPLGFTRVVGAGWPHARQAPADDQHQPPHDRHPGARAIDRNWLKLHPSCLGTHAAIDAAALAHARGTVPATADDVVVRVHPLARQAAHLDVPSDGLAAKFSIPYCVAYTLIHQPPGVADFVALDPDAVQRCRRVRIVRDESLPEWGAVITSAGHERARVEGPSGSPQRPASAAELRRKLRELAGDRLDGFLNDLGSPVDLGILRPGQ